MALTKVTGQVIKNTTDVTVGVLTVTNTLAVGGTVSIGGTLTYEDVTNVDAVGLITARNGIVVGSGITLSKDGDVFFTGIATGNGSGLTALNATQLTSGTVPTARLGSGTASSSTFLRGDSTFAAVTSTTINNNAANRIVTGSGTANTLTANSDLLWNGSRLDIDTGGTEDALRIGSSSGADTFIRLGSTGTTADTHAVLKYDVDDNYVSLLVSGESHGNGGILIANGGAVSLSAGTSPSAKLHVKDDIYVKGSSGDGSVGIQIRSGGSALSNQHQIRTGGGSGDQLFIEALGASSAIVTKVAGSERLRIASDGDLTLTGADNVEIKMKCGTSSGNNIIAFQNSGATTRGNITYDSDNNFLLFNVNQGERLRIDSSGRVLIGQTSSINGVYGSPPPRFSVSTTTASPAIFATYSNDVYGSRIDLIKSRSTTVGGTTVVQAGDAIGEIVFGGADGDQFHPTAIIQSAVESGVGNNDMPGDLRFYTNGGATTGTERMRINSAGIITKPYNPSFMAYADSQWYDVNAGNTIHPFNFNNIAHNIGSHYKNSGSDAGKFIAPVDGVYQLNWNIFVQCPTNQTTAATIEMYVRKNGSSVSRLHNKAGYGNNGDDQQVMNLCVTEQLSANDEITTFFAAYIANWRIYGGHTTFSGFLVG